MSEGHPPGPGGSARVVGIGSAVALMVWGILVVGPRLTRPPEPSPHPEPTRSLGPARPIAAEADVFRTVPGDLAPPPDAERRTEAHPRTLAMWRSTRAYPGAPPRIPHGLMPAEYQGGRCNACHERGGYVERFASYAPVTPHPELVQCLQCHVPDDALVDNVFPEVGTDAVCQQCHAPTGRRADLVPLDWPTPAWPQIGGRAMEGSPPWIPHDLQLRGNCLACHMGPGGVEEIRTTHPERANCRQCHVPAPVDQGVFTRPLDGPAARDGGGS